MSRPIVKGSTDQSTVVRIIDSTDGTPETGVTSATAGLDLQYRREGAAAVALTESDLATVDAAHADGGMIHIGAGYYRVDLPDAAIATGANGVLVFGTVTGMIVQASYHPLVAFDLQSATVTVGTNNDKTGYSISGTLTTLDALNTQLATDHGAGSWITATGFSTHSAADVWSVATRTLTAFAFTVDVNMGQTTPTTPTADTLGEALRFAHERLDAAVTTRSSHTAADVWSVATRTLTAFGFTVDINMGQALPATPTADTTGAALKDADTNLDATVSSRLASASYTAPDNASIAAILDDTGTSGVVVATGSKTGYSLAATGTDLVLVDGKTLPAALQIIAAAAAGLVSGAGTGTEAFKGLDSVTTRLTVTVDASGNRTAITYG